MGKVLSNTSPKYTSENSPAGIGPDYPDYWINEDYWVAEGCPVSRAVKESAEKILAPLDADNIAKVAVVCMPDKGFVNPGIWADRFGTFYKIGLANGPRKNNGMVWLLIYNERKELESIHYAIGDGLPFTTAGELGPVMHNAQQDKDLGSAILALSSGFDSVARADYEPWDSRKPEYGGPIDSEDDSGSSSFLLVVLCLGFLAFLGAVTIVTEPLLGVATFVLGSSATLNLMAWPLYVIYYVLQIVAYDSGKSGGAVGRIGGKLGSGKSAGGGGSFHRSR